MSSVLLVLAFPKPNVSIAAFFCLIPLMMATEGKGGRDAFFLGWAAGLVWFFTSLNWLAQTISLYGGIPFPLNQILIVLMAAMYALFLGFFGWSVAWATRFRNVTNVFLIPSTWVCLEYLRSWYPGPFPWLHLGTSLWNVETALPLYGLFGVYGLSFLIVAVNVSLLHAVRCLTSMRWLGALKWMSASALVLVLTVCLGKWAAPKEGETLLMVGKAFRLN